MQHNFSPSPCVALQVFVYLCACWAWVLQVAGIEGRHIALLVTDNNITDEAMLADVNGLLNTGEVTGRTQPLMQQRSADEACEATGVSRLVLHPVTPCKPCILCFVLILAGLFAPEEQAMLLEQLHPWLATQPELRPGRGAAWEAFINRARHHLHIVFATSPVGPAFRTRCRQFPSLVNCMTIDWFSPWPPEALLAVGVKAVEGLNLAASTETHQDSTSKESLAKALRVARMCVSMHKDMEAASEQLFQEQQRR